MFFPRLAAMSEKKVNQDQRLTENTLSDNKQSDLETEYTHTFKDGERADFIEFIQRKRQQAGPSSATEGVVGASRLACFIFEVQISILLPRVLSKLEYNKIILYGGSKMADASSFLKS